MKLRTTSCVDLQISIIRFTSMIYLSLALWRENASDCMHWICLHSKSKMDLFQQQRNCYNLMREEMRRNSVDTWPQNSSLITITTNNNKAINLTAITIAIQRKTNNTRVYLDLITPSLILVPHHKPLPSNNSFLVTKPLHYGDDTEKPSR